VLGSSGCGKTTLCVNALVAELVAAGSDPATTRLGCFIVDPKGDTVEGVLAGLAATAPERLDDVRWLDPFSSAGFAFNLNHLHLGETPLDIRALQLADLVADVSTSTASQAVGIGARQRDVLQHVLLSALSCPHPAASVLLALDALELPDGLARLATLTTSERGRQFCQMTKLSDELRVSCASRLRVAFNATDSLGRLVSAPTCVQFDGDLLEPGRITLVNLGNPIGGLTALQTFYANIIVRLACDQLLARPSPWPHAHARLVIDEAQVVARTLADIAERILTIGRSKGISLTTITQSPTLIQAASNTLLRVLLTNAAAGKIVGRLSAPDAELLARERAPSQGVSDSLGEVRGRFLSAITNLRDREFILLRGGQQRRFAAAPVDTSAWSTASARRAATLRSVRERLALGTQIRARLKLADVPPPPERGRRSRTATTVNDSEHRDLPAPPTQALVPPRSRWG
jgi:hypothetical protein